jgi:hypothetical protein
VQTQTLARELIDYRQHADPATVCQPLRDEVHAPPPVRAHRYALRYALPLCPLLAPLRAHDQTLFRVQPADALRVHLPPLAPQQDRQPAIAIAHTAARQLAQSHPQAFLPVAMMLIA